MPEQRYAVIHFNDGATMKINFPAQSDAPNMVSKIQKLLDSPCLVIEAEGSLVTIPMSSIKYIQSYPAPDVLPELAIKGAVIID